MGAIAPHHTATSDGPWDGPAAKANLKNDGTEAYYRSAFAWQDPDGDPTKKSSYKFIHHEVSSDGKVGPANLRACSAGIAALNGGRGGADIPDSDRKGVHSHLAMHLTDAGKDVPELAAAERDLIEQMRERHHALIAQTGRSALIERRIIASTIELRQAPMPGQGDPGAQPVMLEGYAAKFDSLSLPLGMMGFREEIDPRAFDETLAQDPDVRFTLNHEPNKVFGRTKAGTLKLSRDGVGLKFEVELPDDNQDARALACAVRRGDISQCSFAFRTINDDWIEDPNGGVTRRLLKVSLDNGDVAAVTYPAYPDTNVDARSLESVEQHGRDVLDGWRIEAEARARELALLELE